MKQHLIRNSLDLVAGNIPLNLGWCQSLTYLDVSHNKLSGSIPPSIGALKQLQTFYFQANNLTGSVLSSIDDLKLTWKVRERS